MADNLNELPSLYTVTGDIKDINTLLISREAVRLNAQGVPDTREMFNAGWCAAARFCDREDVVYDGLVGPGGCPAFEDAYRDALSAAQDAPTEEVEALNDMLSDARLQLDMLREALGVTVEPHQSLFERMMDAARGAQWVDLTDDDRERAFKSMPDMLDGFLKKWGWLHFAKAIEAICREKNDNRAAQDAPAVSAGDALPTVHRTAPEYIYLCIGDEAEQRDAPFDELSDITWSHDQPVDVTVPYVRADLAAAPAAQAVPQGLEDRIEAAIQRIVDNHAPRRIPADPTDVDLVLAEALALIRGKWPPFWIHEAAPAAPHSQFANSERDAPQPAAQGEPSAWRRIEEDAEVDVPLDTDLLLAWWDEWSEAWKIEANHAGSERGGWRHGRATHWMPLPAPPSAAHQKGASK